MRSQFTHMIDVAPTILELAGIPVPATVDGIEQEPMHGTTFTQSLTDPAAAEHRTQQYFETVGNRGMYKDGWWLAVKTERIPWVLTPEAILPGRSAIPHIRRVRPNGIGCCRCRPACPTGTGCYPPTPRPPSSAGP